MSGKADGGCKIDRVAKKRELGDVDARLRERWTDGESLRSLETYFNRSVLRAAMQTAGMDTLDGEVSNLYRLLTDKDVSAGERVDAESRLRQNSVDPSAIKEDFVSYGTVRTHFNECLGIETARDSHLDAADARNTVLKLLSRTESVTNRTIERLVRQGTLTITSPTVTLSLRVGCSECNAEYSFSQLTKRGGCSCPEDD